jgi:hypothetical protein
MLDRRLLKKVGFIENDDHILAQGLFLSKMLHIGSDLSNIGPRAEIARN